jgi:hypothetical protein
VLNYKTNVSLRNTKPIYKTVNDLNSTLQSTYTDSLLDSNNNKVQWLSKKSQNLPKNNKNEFFSDALKIFM